MTDFISLSYDVIPSPDGQREINYFIFSPYPELRIFGADSYNTSVLTGSSNYGSSSTNQFSLMIPWEGVFIDGTYDVTHFEVGLDLENIIEVYEGPTSADDDDIITLANGYWERFSLETLGD